MLPSLYSCPFQPIVFTFFIAEKLHHPPMLLTQSWCKFNFFLRSANFPWLRIKFPDFSTLNIFFSDHFPDLWQPWPLPCPTLPEFLTWLSKEISWTFREQTSGIIPTSVKNKTQTFTYRSEVRSAISGDLKYFTEFLPQCRPLAKMT